MEEIISDQQFFPHACHVCYIYGSKAVLFVCKGCRMISYCSKSHQKIDWPEHKTICKAIQCVRNRTDLMNYEHLTWKGWIQNKRKLLKEVDIYMTRALEISETDMLLKRLECIVCYKLSKPGSPLYRCHRCASASFCINHRMDTEHAKYCNSYKLAFLIETHAVDSRESSLEYLNYIFPTTLPHDMRNYVEMYLIPYYKKTLSSGETLTLETPWLLHHTNLISNPLTLFSAVKKLNFNLNIPEMIIHHVSAEAIEKNVEAWEHFLHLAPELISLRVIIVGPNVCPRNVHRSLCENCINRNQSLRYEYIIMPYMSYLNTQYYTRPDIIVAFDINATGKLIANIDENLLEMDVDAAMPPREMLSEINCPYIFTCREQNELNNEMFKINGALKRNITYLYYGKNEFAGLRPMINPYGVDVYYENEFIIIYKTFH